MLWNYKLASGPLTPALSPSDGERVPDPSAAALAKAQERVLGSFLESLLDSDAAHWDPEPADRAVASWTAPVLWRFRSARLHCQSARGLAQSKTWRYLRRFMESLWFFRMHWDPKPVEIHPHPSYGQPLPPWGRGTECGRARVHGKHPFVSAHALGTMDPPLTPHGRGNCPVAVEWRLPSREGRDRVGSSRGPSDGSGLERMLLIKSWKSRGLAQDLLKLADN